MENEEMKQLALEYSEFRHAEFGQYTPEVLIGFMEYKIFRELKRLNDSIADLKEYIATAESDID